MLLLVHGSTFWCPRRGGTIPIHLKLGLVMKPYRGNDTAGGLDARMKENREDKILNALHSRNGRLYREPHPAHPSLPPHLVRGKCESCKPIPFESSAFA